jgi:hypothetical protein
MSPPRGRVFALAAAVLTVVVVFAARQVIGG